MSIYNQSQRQYLYDAINAENPTAAVPMGLNNALIGTPREIETTETGANTEIVIRGRQGRGYAGGQTFRYKRLSLNDIFKNMIPTVTSPQAYGSLGIADRKNAFAQNINARYGLNLEAADIPNMYVYLNTKNTLYVNASSIQYVGSFTFNSVKGKNSLEEAILDGVLSVLSHPTDPAEQKLCATLLSYGVDFTDEPQIMQAFVDGRMDVGANFTTGASDNLLSILDNLGLPTFDYTGASIRRVKTAAESRANTAYDKVLVITGVSDVHVSGDWLLHYND